MAKSTRSKRPASRAARTRSSSTSKKFTPSRWSRFSGRQRMMAIVFIVLFGGLGAYFIFKSFAATSAVLTSADYRATSSSGTSVITETGSNNKRNAQVILLNPAASSKAVFNSTTKRLDLGTYKVCLFARVTSGAAQGTITWSSFQNGAAVGTVYTGSYNLSAQTNYTQVGCFSNARVATPNIGVQATVTNTGSGAVRIGSVTGTLIAPPPSTGGLNKDRVGIVTSSPYLPSGVSETQYWDEAKKSGVGWIRIDAIMGSPFTNTSIVDGQLAQAQRVGIKVLAILDYSVEGDNGHHAPSNPTAWATYAGNLVAHWKSAYPGVVNAVEVWNEPNITSFWNPPDVVKYTNLLKLTYPKVKAANPNVTVLTGGTANAVCNLDVTISSNVARCRDGSGNYSQALFVKGIYDNGGKSSFDAVAMHPYQEGTTTNRPDDGYRQAFNIRKVMNLNGDQAKKIWGTEAGWVSCINRFGYILTESQRTVRLNGDLSDWFYGKHSAADGSTVSSGTLLDWNTGPFFIYKLYKNSSDSPGYGLVYANNTCDAGQEQHSGFYEPPVFQALRSFTATAQ